MELHIWVDPDGSGARVPLPGCPFLMHVSPGRASASGSFLRDSGALTRESVAALFGVAPEYITDFVAFDPALAIKFSMIRPIVSGTVGDGDIYGAQQYGPLFDIDIPPA